MKKITLFLAASFFSFGIYAQTASVDLVYKKASSTTGSDYYEVVDAQRAEFNKIKEQRELTLLEKKSYKHFERWAYFWRDRVSADGSFPAANAGYVNADVFNEVFNDGTLKHKSDSAGTWKNIGPSSSPNANGYPNPPQVGRLNTFWRYVDGTDANKNILIVGAPTGGIWKSTDNGATWSPKFDQFAGIGITDIKGSSSDAATAGVLYATTGDYDGTDVLNSIGVYKSTDMGETWVATGLVYELMDGQLLGHLAVFDDNTVVVAAKNGIKRTTDGGTTWTDVYTGGSQDLSYGRMGKSGNFLLCSDAAEGLIYSRDKGATWDDVIAFNQEGKYAIAVDENGSFYIQDDKGQLKTVGFTGTTAAANNIGSPSTGYSSQQGYNQTLLVKSGLIVDGSVNGNSSSDWGTNWYTSLNGYKETASDPGVYMHSDHHQAGFLDAGLSFWIAHDGGLSFVTYASKTDQSPTLEYKSNGVVVTQVYAIAINPSDSTNDHFMMANQDNDGFSKEDNQWVAAVAGDGVCAAIDYNNPEIRYLGGTEGQLVRSNGTKGFTGSYQGDRLTTPGNAEFVWPLNLHTTTPTTLYGGFDEFYKSTDKGNNWTNLNAGVGKPTSFDNQGDYIAVVGTTGSTFSSNGGTSWTKMFKPTIGLNINSVSIDAASTDGKTIYATVSGYGDKRKVYRSTDGGGNWTNISTNLPNVLMKKILFKQNGDGKHLYVGTELGVYYSSNTGATWSKLGSGFPNVIVNDLKINYVSDKLYVGTYGRGMWEIPLASKKDDVVTSVEYQLLEQGIDVYPNPTSGKSVNVSLDGFTGSTEYVVYNVVGGVIAKGSMNGTNNVISLDDAHSGTYVISLVNGKNRFTRKLIVK